MRRLPLLLLLSALPVLAADTLGKTPVKTTAKSDVQVQLTDQAGATLLNIQSNNSSTGAGGGAQVLIGNVQTSAPTYVSGNLGMPWVGTNGSLHVTIDSGAGSSSNLTQINGVAISATNAMPSQLTDGTSVYVGTKTGQLPSALGQSTKSGSVSVALASDQGTLAVSQGAPTGATNAFGSTVNISSGATSTLTCASSLSATTPVKLYRVRVAGGASARCVVRYNNNASMTNWLTLMTSTIKPTDESVLPAGFVGLTTGSTGTQAIEASCTNFDAVAQDFSCDVSYCIGATGC
jgi:hypothetical protein